MKWCADTCINCKCCRWKNLAKTDVIYLTKLSLDESSWATSLRRCQVVANYPSKLERGSPPTLVGSWILRSRLLTVHPFPPYVSVEGVELERIPPAIGFRGLRLWAAHLLGRWRSGYDWVMFLWRAPANFTATGYLNQNIYPYYI